MDQEQISTIPPPSRAPLPGPDWTRLGIITLGIISMAIGGLLSATPAGLPLIAAGGGLVGWTVPFRKS